MEFLNTAFELEKYTVQVVHRETAIPKRYRFTLGHSLMQSAKTIGDSVIYANSIYPDTNKPTAKDEFLLRRSYQNAAIREIQIMLKDLRLVSELLPIKDAVLEEWVGLLLKEEKVVKAWRSSDWKRFGRLLGHEEADEDIEDML